MKKKKIKDLQMGTKFVFSKSICQNLQHSCAHQESKHFLANSVQRTDAVTFWEVCIRFINAKHNVKGWQIMKTFLWAKKNIHNALVMRYNLPEKAFYRKCSIKHLLIYVCSLACLLLTAKSCSLFSGQYSNDYCKYFPFQ